MADHRHRRATATNARRALRRPLNLGEALHGRIHAANEAVVAMFQPAILSAGACPSFAAQPSCTSIIVHHSVVIPEAVDRYGTHDVHTILEISNELVITEVDCCFREPQ